MDHLVSVMMPAYNSAMWIGQAIESVLGQTYKNLELVIHDDGSTDDTLGIALSYAAKDDRVRVSGGLHRGCPTARNRCAARCGGGIIARQDADDLQSEDRIAKQVQYLLDNRDKDIVTCRMNWLQGARLIPKRAGAMDANKYRNGLGSGPVCASIVAWRAVYDGIGVFDELMLAGSDGDWNHRALRLGFSYGFIDEHLYTQRRHPRQISNRMRSMQRKNHETSRTRNRPR